MPPNDSTTLSRRPDTKSNAFSRWCAYRQANIDHKHTARLIGMDRIPMKLSIHHYLLHLMTRTSGMMILFALASMDGNSIKSWRTNIGGYFLFQPNPAQPWLCDSLHSRAAVASRMYESMSLSKISKRLHGHSAAIVLCLSTAEHGLSSWAISGREPRQTFLHYTITELLAGPLICMV